MSALSSIYQKCVKGVFKMSLKFHHDWRANSFKYSNKDSNILGIMRESDLSFETQTKKVYNRVKYNLANFWFIRNCISIKAVRMYMNGMIILHLTYCLTSWSQASSSTLTPLESLYKQIMKTSDKKFSPLQHTGKP